MLAGIPRSVTRKSLALHPAPVEPSLHGWTTEVCGGTKSLAVRAAESVCVHATFPAIGGEPEGGRVGDLAARVGTTDTYDALLAVARVWRALIFAGGRRLTKKVALQHIVEASKQNVVVM